MVKREFNHNRKRTFYYDQMCLGKHNFDLRVDKDE